MIDPASISPGKVYLIDGNDLRDMLEEIAKNKIIGTEGQIKPSRGPEGTRIGFASEVKCYVTANGDEVAVLIPMRATA